MARVPVELTNVRVRPSPHLEASYSLRSAQPVAQPGSFRELELLSPWCELGFQRGQSPSGAYAPFRHM